jgi:DNA mismatch repair protein MutS2
MVAALAASDLGRGRILELSPLPAGRDLESRRQRFEEAAIVLSEGPLVPSFERPLAPLLERLSGAGKPLSGSELLDLGVLLEASRRAATRIREEEPPLPELAQAATVPDLADFLSRLRTTLDRRGQVREDATPELARLRQSIRRQRDELYQSLQGVVARHRELLSEETIPMREGRLVLVLQSGSRGRLPGLVHGRSGTGKSFYFEPLEVVEGNNRLRQAWDEEEAEKARILAELQAEAQRCLPGIREHAELVAELDLLQAAHAFASRSSGTLPELAGSGELRLVQARHPLLEPALAELREESLGEAGHRSAVVPLDVELSTERRVLVITGPNAGGKTVALKTIGLVTLAAHCGLPSPVARGKGVPLLEAAVATVGDEQDLLAERSTFSGRLLRLREAWEAAGPGSLILLDELGSGTDPEEGGALAGALLEGLLARGALVVVTTHLAQLAAEAMEAPGAFCAAMELDPETGEPRFRLLPGPPGASEALALARRLGLAPELLARAESRLGRAGRDYRALLGEVAALRQQLAEELASAAAHSRRLARERELLEQQAETLEEERRSLAERYRRELGELRRQVKARLQAEIERLDELRRELPAARRRRLVAETTARLLEDAPRPEPPEEASGEIRLGEPVRHRTLGWQGVLERLERGRATARVGGKRLRCDAQDLAPAASAAAAAPTPPRPAPGLPRGLEVPAELHLIGSRVDVALERLDEYLDQGLRSERRELRVVHGHGSGRLRDAVRRHLRTHPAVAEHRPGAANEGGDGATVVMLRD